MQDSKKESKLGKISGTDKIKRVQYEMPVTLKIRWWLRPVLILVKIWHICGGTTPSKTTTDWLATHGTKRVFGKIRVKNGKDKKGS